MQICIIGDVHTLFVCLNLNSQTISEQKIHPRVYDITAPVHITYRVLIKYLDCFFNDKVTKHYKLTEFEDM